MSVLGFAHAAWADLVACTTLYALWRSRRGPPRSEGTAPTGRVLLVRPCAGAHEGMLRALASSVHARGAEIVFAVRDEDDAAAPIAKAIHGGAEVVLTRAAGPNRKAQQIAAAVQGRTFDTLVIADDDVELEEDTLARLLAPLADARVGATWAAPREVSPVTPADRASSAILGSSLHAFPVLHALDARVFVGKLFAIRADVLARCGGFSALAGYLGEDAELARRVRALGSLVVRADVDARSLASRRSFSDVIARYARWVSVVRAQQPALLAAYPLLFAATPFIVTIAIARGDVVALAFGAFALSARLLLSRTLGGALVLAPVHDLVLLAAFARALASRRVVWRGVALRLEGERAREERQHSLRDAHP